MAVEDKNLLLTITHRGIDIIKIPKESVADGRVNKKLFPTGINPRVTESYWRGDKWQQYRGDPGKFCVEKNQKIIIHKDNDTYLNNYIFSDWDRPNGLKYHHWDGKAMALDDPRDDSGAYIKGVHSRDIFANGQFGTDKIEFVYTRKTRSYNSEQSVWENDYFIAYDLFLRKPTAQMNPAGNYAEGDYIWHGPIIRNDGGRP